MLMGLGSMEKTSITSVILSPHSMSLQHAIISQAQILTSLEEILILVLIKGQLHEASAQAVVGEHHEHVLEHFMHSLQVLNTEME